MSKIGGQIASRENEREKTAYLRRSVAKILNEAVRRLPKGMTFVINDAWRPKYVQDEIKKRFIEHFGKKNPNWSDARVLREVNKFVAASSGKLASGHMTGGAVDLRLYKNGRKIPMISRELTYQQNAKSKQDLLKKYLQENRKIMFDALESTKISNYPKEYWHWSYGDVQWANREGRKIARYGVITSTDQFK